MADQDNAQLPAAPTGSAAVSTAAGPTGTAVAVQRGAAVEVPTNPYLAGLGTLSLLRQVMLIAALAASVAIAVWVVLWSREPDMRPLYASMEHLDAGQVVEVLAANDIRYRIDQASGMLLVDSARIHDARMQLASAGFPTERAVGFEVLEEQQALGTSQFMETARFRRSLEGELARTIASITRVKAARVHLAIPERSVFMRDQRKPSASVLLELFAGRRISEEQVRAIGNLVASSIPSMDLTAVTIVDQKGGLLSDFTQDETIVAANRQMQVVERVERQLVERIRRILEPVVGADRFKSEVSADLDFTQVEQADEIFNPDLPALRSESTVDEQRSAAADAAGVPGALSNQPPAAGTALETADTQPGAGAGAGPRNQRSQATRNFELDRSLSYTRHQVGRVRRLSVAVVLDNRPAAVDQAEGDAGTSVGQAWSDAELARVGTLVRDAVGFDAGRGDSVNVVNAPFVVEVAETFEIEAPPFWQSEWFFPLLRQSAGILFILILGFAILRPVLLNLSASAHEIRRVHSEEVAARERAMREALEPAVDDPLLQPPVDYEQRRRLTAVKTLIEEDSERVAQVVRKWVRDSG